MTGGRIKRIQEYIGNEDFMLIYGGGVCDVNISELVDFHNKHGKLVTKTSVIKKQGKDVIDISELDEVKSFREIRPGDDTPINAMVL